MKRIQRQNLQHLSDFGGAGTQHGNDCRNKDIADTRRAASDGGATWHLEAGEQFSVSAPHEIPLPLFTKCLSRGLTHWYSGLSQLFQDFPASSSVRPAQFDPCSYG